MRLFSPSGITFHNQSNHRLLFKQDQSQRFVVSVLDQDLIRVQHLPDSEARLNRTWLIVDENGGMPREGRSRDDVSPFALPDYDLQQMDDQITVKTDQLQLTIHLDTFRIDWHNADNQLFHADSKRVAYTYNKGGRDVFHYCERNEGEYYYGFGERAGALSKVGMRMRMVNHDALGYSAEMTDPLYKHCPFYITFNPKLNIAYGLFYDNLSTTTFDMGKEIDAYRGVYRSYHAEDGDLDYYLIYGPTIEQVLEKYTKLTGRPALMPRWTFGYLGSTMKYTEAENAQEQLKEFAQLCQEHNIPCDLFHLSSGYTTNADGERCVFTWNQNRVPDPQAMVDDFHQAGIRLTPNIKPYILKTHPNYDEITQKGGFIKQAESDDPQIAVFWSGGVNEMGDGSYLDFTSDAGYSWWQEKIQEQLLAYGMDALWNDNNEYEIWDDAARCAGFGDEIPVGMIRPLHSLLMGHASYHALLEKYPNQRPFVVSRSGAPGIQRYAQIWSGDNNTSWNDMRYGITVSLGSGLSGLPNTSNDVGGFFGPMPEAELLVRWVQNHIFHPRFCIHSWNTDKTVTEPWTYPDVLPIIREAIHLRYKLIPYLYSLHFESARMGHPMICPLVYHFPQDENCHTESFQFLLGSHLMVASVIEEGATTREVYLPAADSWCDFYTGEWYEGGQTITVDAPLEHIPLFVRAGGIIPMGKVMAHVGAEPDNLRQVYLYPHPSQGESVFSLIEDDGVSLAYQKGSYSSINIQMQSDNKTVILGADITPYNYNLSYQELECILPPNDTRTIEGGANQWVDEQHRQHAIIPIA